MPANDSSAPSGSSETAQDLHDQIAIKAYEIFQSRESADGSDLDDWLQAEKEVLRQRSESNQLHTTAHPSVREEKTTR